MPKKKAAEAIRSKSHPKAKVSSAHPRSLPLPKRVWFKPWTWRRSLPAPSRTPLPKARHLIGQSLRLLYNNKKLLGGIIAIYGLLNLLLVRGLSGSSNLSDVKDVLDAAFNGASGKVLSALSSFSVLLTTSGSGNTAESGMYQSALLLITSLALIWSLRQIAAKHAIRIRDGFYHGVYPLVPFLLVLMVIGLQLIPLLLGGTLYNIAISNGIASDFGEKLAFGLIFAGLGLWSLSMITGSIFALYIVCLPDMTPLKALRSASLLVYKRRLLVWRKLLPMPIFMLVTALVIELPLILFLTPAAEWVFFALSMAGLAFLHSYMYNLYRKLL